MIAKDKHVSDYGGPKGAVLGKVISGKNIIANLKQGDTLLKNRTGNKMGNTS